MNGHQLLELLNRAPPEQLALDGICYDVRPNIKYGFVENGEFFAEVQPPNAIVLRAD